MKIKQVGALMMVVGMSFSTVAAAAGHDEQPPIAIPAPADTHITLPAVAGYAPHVKRPAVLPALYVTLGAMQAWDLISTSAAIKAGAHEANPAAAAFANSRGSMLGLKAVTTASTIVFAERAWKKNKVAAVAMMVVVNGGVAAVAMNNMRNAQAARARH